ncbi:MAG: glycosyl transferase, partial [Pseudomonadota bacterium]
VPLFLSGRSASDVRAEAARLQRIEHKFLKVLRSPHARARIQIMTLAEFIEAPTEVLQAIIDEIAGHRGSAVTALPEMANLDGLATFLQDLKNQGMHPFLTGELSDKPAIPARRGPAPKPYVVGRK